MTKHELLEKLRRLDEVDLIDVLGLHSDEIVDAFIERILENYEYIYSRVND